MFEGLDMDGLVAPGDVVVDGLVEVPVEVPAEPVEPVELLELPELCAYAAPPSDSAVMAKRRVLAIIVTSYCLLRDYDLSSHDRSQPVLRFWPVAADNDDLSQSSRTPWLRFHPYENRLRGGPDYDNSKNHSGSI
jgi:hypothetical protein